MKRNYFILSIFMFLLVFSGCENDQDSIIDTNDKTEPLAFTKGSDDVTTAIINLDNCGETASTQLLAGQHILAGDVSVSVEGGMLSVTYQTVDGWVISETQLHVASSEAEIPQNKKGNPKIGNFEYKTEHSPAVITYTYSGIDVSDLGEVTIAAHAVVSRNIGQQASLEAIEALLPENFDLKIAFIKDPSYFDATITNSGVIDGVYNSFCVDLDHGIQPGKNYKSTAISSYSSDTELLAKLVDRPENIDLVNYMVNQDYSSLGARGNELQAVIWTLIDDITPKSGTGGISWNQNIVNAIIADAQQNGEGYVPECDGSIMIILNSANDDGNIVIKEQVTMVQVQMIEFPNVCEEVYSETETAWGEGENFGAGSWAMYFKYCLSDPTGCELDLAAIENYIPVEKINAVVEMDSPTSYFATTISNGGVLDGVFEGFCVDLDHYITPGNLYQMYVFSTYGDDQEWLAHYVDKPENYDLLNYIVNQEYDGITKYELQVMVWSLIDDRDLIAIPPKFNYDINMVETLLADAYANGEGFVPGCDDFIVFILDPNPDHDIRSQVTLIKFPVNLIPNSSVGVY